MSSNSQNSEAPVLGVFQFDPSTAAQGVNLFRGSLSFPFKLLTLPGRNNLAFDITMLYQSNVETLVDNWNLTAPTDILGVGWSMPYDHIVADARNTGSTLDDQYYLISGGQTIPLFAIPAGWARADLSAGAELGSAMRLAGVPLSTNIRIEQRGAKTMLFDDAAERSFVLTKRDDGSLAVTTGGTAYEVTNNPFWQLVYYADYEKWELTKDDGTVLEFGGSGDAITPGVDPNVVQWGIRWGNWIGPSVFTDGQTRYAKGWNLASITNPAGNSIVFNYTITAQTVGFGTLTYTKESHISKIKNDLGWVADFTYQPMTYDYSSPAAPKEYLDPHTDPTLPPTTNGNAFQASYNTKYLQKIDVSNDSGEVQMTLALDYHPLQNLTTFDANNALGYGATYKRYLKSITEIHPDGYDKPPLLLDYNFSTDTETNRGALTKMTYPTGGAAIFAYTPISMGASGGDDPGARNIVITNPFGGTAAPRVWYGQDYVVVGWYSSASSQLKVNVYTWLGRWYPSYSSPLTFNGTVDLDSLQAATSANTFLLAIPNGDKTSTNVYLFNRMHLADGNWTMQQNPYTYASGSVGLATGLDFFVVGDAANSAGNRFSWNWMTRSWDVADLASTGVLCQSSGSTYAYFLAAGATYYLFGCYDIQRQLTRFSLFYRDELLNWNAGGFLDASDIKIIAPSDSGPFASLSPGGSFAAFAWMTNFDTSNATFDYSLRVLGWDTSFQNLNFVQLPSTPPDGFTQVPVAIARSIGPNFVDNTTVASGPNLFQFNGSLWTYQYLGIRFGSDPNPDTQYFWYSYAVDSALNTENTSSGVYSALNSINLNDPTSGWQTQVLTNVAPPPPGRETQYFPTDAGDYLTQNTDVYGRSVYPYWINIQNFFLARLSSGSSIDTTTMIDQAPYFLAFMTLDGAGNPNSTSVVFYRNGNLLRDSQGNPVMQTFDGQQMFRFLDRQHRYKTALSGLLPAIPLGFITFPTTDNENAATQITLHRYANEAITGPIETFVLDTLTVDSGYDQLVRCYEYDGITAAQSASGTIPRFNQVSVYLATTDPEQQKYGRTTTNFFNGLPPSTGIDSGDTNATNSYSVLDGMLISEEQFDVNENLVASAENTWKVADQISITADGTQLRNLYGGIPQISLNAKMIDGVRRSTVYTYSNASGAPTIVSTQYYGSTGQLITSNTSTMFAFEVYPTLWNQNVLKPAAQTTVTGDAGVQSILVQTSKQWTKSTGENYWAEWESWVALDPAAPAFQWWNGGTPGSLWRRTESIQARTDEAQVTGSIDVQSRPLTLVYDNENRMPIAQFVNATAQNDGASYDSFEPYQPQSWSWSGSGGATIIDSDSFTGSSCMQMTQAGSLTKTVTVSSPSRRYVFGLFLKNAAANVTLRITSGSNNITKALSATGGSWLYQQWVADLSSFPAGQVTLAIDVAGAGDVRIDDVAFYPLDSQFSASVYDFDLLRLTASLSPNGAVQRNVFNGFGEISASTGVYDNPRAISTVYLSCSTNSSFAPSTPNCTVNLGARGAGFIDEFKDGSLALYDYIDSTQSNWSVAGRLLTLNATSSAPLGARVSRKNFSAESLAIYFFTTASSSTRVSAGDGTFFVVWTGSQWQLDQLTGGTVTTVATNAGAPFANEWLLTIFDDRILFFGDGVQIFSYASSAVVSATHAAQLGLGAPASFRDLVVAQTISVVLNFTDGISRATQSAMMETGDAVILNARLYDDRGLPEINVKPTRVTTAQLANPFSYYDGFITNASFTSSLWQGAPMTGPASDLHPNDGGYPFTRQVLEASPLARVVQLGKPGLQFAVTQSGNPHITKNSYGTNSDAGPFLYPLPKGQYLLITTVDADGNSTTTWSDTEQSRIGVVVTGTGMPGAGWRTSMVFDGSGRPTASIPPSYYATAGGPSSGATIPPSATTASFNYIGERITISNPDQGASKCLYNQASLVRFTQDAAGAANGTIRYIKYDSLNRQIEDGEYATAWDPATLQQHVNDNSWPPAPTTWTTRSTYDGNDSTPNMVGRLWIAAANNSGSGTADVTDTFAYDLQGNVITKTRQTTSFRSGTSFTIQNTYDDAGFLLSTTDSVTGATTTNAYNALGQISGVSGASGGPASPLLAVDYTQEGQVNTIRMVPNGGTRQFSYAPPLWPEGSTGPAVSESLAYTSGNCNGGGYYTGSVSQQTITYDERTQQTDQSCFTVDALNEIITAGSGANAESWNFDLNGNTQTLVRSGVTRTYAYPASTNQLASITSSDGSFTRNYTYDPSGSGQVKTVTNGVSALLTLSYNTVGNVSSVALPNGAIAYQYDPGGDRTLKTVTGAGADTIFTLTGANSTLQLSGPNGATAVRLAIAPGTRLVFYDGAWYFALLDHLGSTRAILASDGTLVGEYDYDLYGTPEILTAAPFPFRWLFTGQPWDASMALYEFPVRLYDPIIGRFLMVDPALQQPSPYAYVGNNPLLSVDPSGAVAWYWYLTAFVVGAIVTVVTGGLGAVAFGTGIAASMAVGAVAGIAGALATDGVLAAAGEQITGYQLLVDVLSGGVAGIAGAGIGGLVGRGVSRVGLSIAERSVQATVARVGAEATEEIAAASARAAKAVVIASSVASGISGGVAGSVAAAGVTAGMMGQPFFSKATALNALLGAVTGAGSGLMAAGVHLGWLTGPGSLRTVPVELTDLTVSTGDDVPGIVMDSRETITGKKVIVLAPYQAETTRASLVKNGFEEEAEQLFKLSTVRYNGAAIDADTVAVHGVGRWVMIEWRNGNGLRVNRPMSRQNFAQFLRDQGFGSNPVKLYICFGAIPWRFSVASAVRNTLRQDTYAYWKVIKPGAKTDPSFWKFGYP